MSYTLFYPSGRIETKFHIEGVGRVTEACYTLVDDVQTEVTAQDEQIRVVTGTYTDPVWTDTDEGKTLLRDL